MRDKVVLITGATAGIGKATAEGIAKAGAIVALTARDGAKGEAVMAEIQAKTGNDRLSLFVADLSSQESVRRLATNFANKYDRLDVLINNAGAIFDKRITTVDGLEATFALNHLAYFLLTNLLIDLVRASAPARIINVSSIAHSFGKINFDDLQCERAYSRMGAYAQSKLMNALFTYELARRLGGTRVTVNCLHPGAVASDFGKELTGAFKLLGWLARQTITISSERGAETSLYLATSQDVADVTGKYFDKRKSVPSSAASYDAAAAKRLWEISERYVNQTFGEKYA